jgi:Lyzozyme M1 (1,4-beta-N-acetylmuramidase)
MKGKVEKCLDISKHQGTFNAQAAKAAGITAVITRCAYSQGTDVKLAEFAPAIKEAGLKLGFYGFLTAHYDILSGKNFEVARTEMQKQVNHWVNLAKQYEINSWFALDLELESGHTCSLSKEQLTLLANEAMDIMSSAGFGVCIYASASWYISRMNADEIRYPFWVAHYLWSPNDPDFNTGGNDGTLPNVGTYAGFYKTYAHKICAWQFGRIGYGYKYGAGSGNLDKNWLYFNPNEKEEENVEKETQNLSVKFLQVTAGHCQYFEEANPNRTVDEGWNKGYLQQGKSYIITQTGLNSIHGYNWVQIQLPTGELYYTALLNDRCVIIEISPQDLVEMVKENYIEAGNVERDISFNQDYEAQKEKDPMITQLLELFEMGEDK